MPTADLPATWRSRAELLARHGATEAAATCCSLADELQAEIEAEAAGELTLAEAAAASGYSERRLRELLADGTIPQAGRRGAPRIRRGDLPRRARSTTQTGYDAAADAAALVARRTG
jgi:hypothetical protein